MMPSLSTLAWLAAGAVLVFWMLGAYNRLVALRNAIGGAWQQLAATLARREAAAAALVSALREPLAEEAGALDALLTAQAQAGSAREALTPRPVAAEAAAAVQRADAALQAALGRVLSLLDLQPALRDSEAVSPTVTELRETETRQVFERQLFNEAVAAYNDAARQYPTRLLVHLYGFGTAGRL